MTIVQMLYFSTACQFMNLTKAAQKLHISQPALSSVIKQIESECGVMLFQHRANSISITDEGVVLRQEVEPIIKQYKHLEKMIADRQLGRNYIRIGLLPILGMGIMSGIFSVFKSRYPDVQLQLFEEETNRLYEDLDSGKADLIFTTQKKETLEGTADSDKKYESFRLRDIHMVFAVSQQHPLACAERVKWADVVRQPLIMLDESFEMINDIVMKIKRDGYQLPVDTCYTNQISTAMTFIETNTAAGFMPVDAVQRNSRVKGLSFPGVEKYPIYMVYRRDHHQFHAAKLFESTAMELFTEASA